MATTKHWAPAALDELDRLLEAATPGPWELDPVALCASNDDGVLLFDYKDAVLLGDHPEGIRQCAADGELIVAAVNALPRLTAALRAVLDLAEGFDKSAMYGGALVWTRLRAAIVAEIDEDEARRWARHGATGD